ncbi:FG-GAP-like repeat-containing protein [Hahella sp. CR1]|uniref:FG-GAP-like repeat-containing protein n=1 Tax=Hahella sp. CR1 TaxID=2992807 RepID=UPI0024421A63|nr:FG-GAP-like repeat-containing protein [Hahella sp. CR1]MDG9670783.1 FG-GAP-like repeat-containing protein [Hahella sp. CR1]
MRSVSRLLLFVLSIVSTFHASATNLQTDTYTAYYGDVNGDGYEDIYLQSKQHFVLIAGDISVPLYIQGSKSLLISGLDNNLYVWESAVNLDALELYDVRYHQGDFNGDGAYDLLVQVQDTRFDTFILTGSSGDAPTRLKIQSIVSGQNLQYAALFIRDVNSDGRDDLIIQKDEGVELIALANASGDFSSEITKPKYTTPGAIAGSLDVSPTGSATYSISIPVASGGAGMQPELSVSYDSGAGNGEMGMGWSHSGLEMITECGLNYAIDEKVRPVGRYCLNGERLTGYGGGVYYPENESFTRVTAKSSSILFGFYKNVTEFKVEYKSGEIAYFGGSDDKRMHTSSYAGTSLIPGRGVWFLSHITDRYGNRRDYSYELNTATGEHYLKTISYPGGHVEYKYSNSRPDPIKGFDLGSKSETNKRLEKIESWSDVGLVSSFDFIYEISGITGVSRISAIQQCGSDGGCLKKSTFEWGEWKRTEKPEGELYAPNYKGNMRIVDFNGDGRDDFIYKTKSGGLEAFFGSRESHFVTGFSDFGASFRPVSTTSPYWDYAITIDIDGDGDGELLFPNEGTWHLIDYKNREFTITDTGIRNNGYASNPRVLDANGDGLQDLIVQYDNRYYLRMNLGGRLDGNAIDTGIEIEESMTPYTMVYDRDGDGRQELLYVDQKVEFVRVKNDERWTTVPKFIRKWISYGNSTDGSISTVVVSENTMGYKDARLADMNGDGLADLLVRDQGRIYVAYNNGSNFQALINTSIDDSAWSTLKVINYDDDGIDDLLISDNKQFFVISNTTSGYVKKPWFNHGSVSTSFLSVLNTSDWWVTENNGDGVTDLVFTGCTAKDYVNCNPGYFTRTFSKTSSDFLGIDVVFRQDYVKRISNGTGLLYELNYKSDILGNGEEVSAGEKNVIPVVSALNRVSAVTSYVDGVKTSTSLYKYKNGYYHTGGLGFLGYKNVEVNTYSGSVSSKSEQTYSLDWANKTQGMLVSESTSVYKPGGPVNLTSRNLVYETKYRKGSSAIETGKAGWFTYPSKMVEHTYDLSGALEKTVTTEYIPDVTSAYAVSSASGNMVSVKTTVSNPSTGEAYTVDSLSQYGAEDYGKWILGRVTHTQTTSQGTNREAVTKESSWTYDATTGNLLSETIEPNNPLLQVTTTYGYDSNHGQKISETTSDYYGHSRSSYYQWDSKGRYIISSSNSKGHTVRAFYDALTGLKIRSVDVLGKENTWFYDGFGRETKSISATGVASNTKFDFAQTGDPAGTNYSITLTNSLGGWTQTFINARGDTIESRSRNALGKVVVVRSEYDAQGNHLRTSEPFEFGAAPEYWTTNKSFDELMRPTSIENPEGSVASVIFSANQVTYINELGKKKVDVSFADGKLKQAIDHESNIISYEYDGAGNMVTVKDETAASSGLTQISYDLRGRKIAMNDPDKGEWSYQYDAFGSLVAQKDAEGKVVCQAYDELGRLVLRIDNYQGSWESGAADGCSGDASNPKTTRWIYDTAEYGAGQLHKIIGESGYEEEYKYDSFGRVVSVAKKIEGELFVSQTQYDVYGRPVRITYPSGLAVRNHYNQFGALDKILKDDNTTKLWEMVDIDLRGNVKLEKFANGLISTDRSYTPEMGRSESIVSTSIMGAPGDLQFNMISWDKLGNLASRHDARQNKREVAEYDDLNRLKALSFWKNYKSGSSADSRETMSYEANGNIRTKWDIEGEYQYGGVNCGVQAGPHAVTEAGGNAYCYDRNGNMTSGAGRSIQWTTFGKPSKITRGSLSVEFTYGPDRHRIKRVDTSSSGSTVTKYTGGYEKVTKPNGAIDERHYIGGFAVLTKQSGVAELKESYMLKDHLGSVVAYVDVKQLAISSASAVQRTSFDAWGKRRAADWTGLGANELFSFKSAISDRGYTGHEQIDSVGLVHMNGRVYDPFIGRFLSADPLVQAPTDLQSYNRYAYVRNNPLSLTDPSGFSWISKKWKQIRHAVKKAWGVVSPGTWIANKVLREFGRFARKNKYVAEIAQIAGCALGGPLGCAAATAAVTYGVTGGDFKATLIASATAYIGAQMFGAVHNMPSSTWTETLTKAIVHGAIGGLMSGVSGGDIKSGFVAAFASHVAFHGKFGGANLDSIMGDNKFFNAAVAAVVGGTASKIAGGNFANGARSAAFARLFNDLKNQIPKEFNDVIKKAHIDLDKNIAEAKSISLEKWKEKVETGGDWDYKNVLANRGFNSKLLDNFGNWHFGVVAAAYGFNLEGSMYGAGLYQVTVQGGGNPTDLATATRLLSYTHGGYTLPDAVTRSMTNAGFTWGDNDGDAINIMNGWDYYDSL